MNNRERFRRIMHFEQVDMVPNIEVGAWSQTVDRWRQEGMPEGTGLETSPITFGGNDFFKIDKLVCVNLNCGMIPGFEAKIIAEDEETITHRGCDGVVRRGMKDGSCMPAFLEFPVKDRKSFEAIKHRYDPHSPGRFPVAWAETVRLANNSDCPVWGPGIGAIGFYSNIRRWMGTENACTIFLDDPVLAHEMCEFILDFLVRILDRVLKEVKLDFFSWFEDYSFKTGPLISPAILRAFLLPRYRRVSEILNAAGTDIVFLDTDGNPKVLLPLLLKAGINGTYPIECAADMDPVRLRKEYGRELLMWGGIDKRILSRTKSDIERELTYKLPALLKEGGYLPMLDHLAPPDIPYENWLFYLELKKKLLAEI